MRKKRTKRKKHLNAVLFILVVVLVLAAVAFYVFTTPKITLNGDKTMEVTMAEGYTEPGATAKFSLKDISRHIKIKSHVDDDKVGTYEVVYTVMYLDKKATAERTVNVVDREPPEIELNEGNSITIRPGEKYEDPGLTAIDDSDGDVTDKVETKGFVDRYNKGEYKVTYTVTDSYGNEAKAVRTVKVKGEPVKSVKGVIYLTFDDGPSNNVTPRILKTLKKYNVPATFFVIDYGKDKKKMKTIRRAIKNGCTIGVHGYSHDYSKIYSSVPAFMENITSLHDKLADDFAYDAYVMRFPGGSSNTVSREYCKGIMSRLVKKVQREGYMYCDWNVDSTDASGNSIAASTLVSAVKNECSKDTYNIILMHDSDAKETTAAALPAIIKWGKSEGYKFRALTLDSPSVHHGVNN